MLQIFHEIYWRWTGCFRSGLTYWIIYKVEIHGRSVTFDVDLLLRDRDPDLRDDRFDGVVEVLVIADLIWKSVELDQS